MKSLSKKKTHLHTRRLVVFLSSLICFIILTSMYLLMLHRDIKSEKTRYNYIAKNEAEHIVTTVDCVMARTNTLKAMIKDHNGDTSFFKNAAEDMYNTVKEETGVSLKNFAIAPNGVVSDVYPLEGNETLIGFDFLDLSHPGNIEAKEAYEQGETILTNPFELIQGGIGMGGRAPVVLNDGDNQTLWGLVTVTIDFENLIEVLNLDGLNEIGVDFALSYIDNDGSVHDMYKIGEPKDDAVKVRFKVRNLTWEMTVAPTNGWIPIWRIIVSILVIVIISAFVGVFASIMFRLHESNAMLLRLSTTDGLTGCLNRRAYEEALLTLPDKMKDDNFFYVTADVNSLKNTNDTLGHLSGDELICGAADCLQDCFGDNGDVYRIGGDEFAAFVYADENTFDKLIEKIHTLTDNWKGNSVKSLTLSIGYASNREFPDAEINTLIKTADERMYKEKREYYQNKGIDRRQGE